MTSPTLEIPPRTNPPNRVRGAVSNAEPTTTATTTTGSSSMLRLPDYTAAGQAVARAAQPNYHAWLNHVRPAAGCTRPIRLTGHLDTIDPHTGDTLAHTPTTDLPDGVIYKACGNRRASVCPSCAMTYQYDAYQLLRAGLVGGKGIPDTVTRHPANFTTLTAPSFGTVHTRTVRRHTCTSRRRCDCRPDPCHARSHGDTGLCQHRQPTVCWARHDPDDPRLGQPLCLDCYDHDHQVVWNLHAGQLWHRTKQAIERYLALLAQRRRISPVLIWTAGGNLREAPPIRVSHGKAAEMQRRGAIHFHALLRLDGVTGDDPDAITSPPDAITGDDLTAAIQHAARTVAFTTEPHPDKPEGWRIAWGQQVDPRPITMAGHGEVTDAMVAGYLAKYATKSTEATGHYSTRLTPDTVDDYADPDGEHTARLIDACWRLGRPTHTPTPLHARPRRPRPVTVLGPPRTCPDCGTTTRLAICPQCTDTLQPVDTYVSNTPNDNPYQGLRRWAHMLGYGGHYLTKARRYSVTFATLREARATYRRTETPGPDHGHPGDHHDQDQADTATAIIVATLTYVGTGWHTLGDALLANTAAALARERQQVGREELAHQAGTTRTTIPTAA
jgi:hypothetical protein